MQPLLPSLALALCTLALAGPLPSQAADEHAGHHALAQPPEAAQVQFADVELTDQHGRPVRLKDEVVGDKIVVMGFIYTSCTTVCPVVSAIMQKVQAQLGEMVGSEVQLVSISVDPLRDTPQRLREYASQFQAGPGWTWLTGPVPAVNDTLKGLGTWSADFTTHPPVIMIGDGRSEQWTRFYGFTDPAVLVGRVYALGAARQHAQQGHDGPGHAAQAAQQEGRP